MFAPLPAPLSSPQLSAPLPPAIARVMNGNLCAGCGLCAGISNGAIIMQMDHAGFARPRAVRPVAPAPASAMSAACPGAVVAPWPGNAHPLWGGFTSCATGHATDPAVRHAGSSGGMLSALAIHALTVGLVDAVVHTGASAEAPLLNVVCLSTSAGEIIANAGSRYGPSPALVRLGALLDDDRRFLLVAKPCDLSAMRTLGQYDPRVAARFPFMLSFFCGGMPSLKGSEAIVREMGLEPTELTAFRYRGDGWPGLALARDATGREGRMSYERSWGVFLSGRVQYRCKICPDAVGGVADIACADAWYGGESGYPSFEDAEGRSLVLVRSIAGATLLEGAVAAGRIALSSLDIAEVALMQPAQARRKRVIAARSLAARALLQPQPRMRGLRVLAAARTARAREALRNFAGSLLRILRQRK